MALGSAFEANYQIILAKDLSYIDGEEFAFLNDKIDKIRRQLAKLIGIIRSN
jgi:four helix bundle protein